MIRRPKTLQKRVQKMLAKTRLESLRIRTARASKTRKRARQGNPRLIQRSRKRVGLDVKLLKLIFLAQYLMESGMLEAYEYILRSLCKAGLPEGNIFDYTASKLVKFETKWKTEQKKKAIV